jgi:hydrogenase maturation protease
MSGGGAWEVLVVGIGNPDRGDDGLGPAVAERLRGLAPAGVCVAECCGDVLALIDLWSKFDAVIVIDAGAANGSIGRIYRFDAAHQPLPVTMGCRSTHALGLGPAIELARSLRRLPRKFIAYVVEGSCFDMGAALSPAIAASIDSVVDRILGELAGWTAAKGAATDA